MEILKGEQNTNASMRNDYFPRKSFHKALYPLLYRLFKISKQFYNKLNFSKMAFSSGFFPLLKIKFSSENYFSMLKVTTVSLSPPTV